MLLQIEMAIKKKTANDLILGRTKASNRNDQPWKVIILLWEEDDF